MANQEYSDLPFVPPRAFGKGRDGYGVQFIVVHHTAGSEHARSAEDGAAYDQRRTDGTSAHYYVDQNSIVQCVYTWDRANTAYYYGNRKGINYELCGTQQTRAQWLDAASNATLTMAARQMARDARKYGIPARHLTIAEMKAGLKGFCGHNDVTLAYGLGNHMDPGPYFPWDVLLSRVQGFIDGGGDGMVDVNWTDGAHAECMIHRIAGMALGHRTTQGGPLAGEAILLTQNIEAIVSSLAELRSEILSVKVTMTAIRERLEAMDNRPVVMSPVDREEIVDTLATEFGQYLSDQLAGIREVISGLTLRAVPGSTGGSE